ncbi:hypothetical protein V9T40_010741 [Parthenolecanium corni]|uniref:Acyltransferase n=1 Tax=Parthenolecanium corni TaxID=536013 RepID=A0AAN9XYV8_9HEMI
MFAMKISSPKEWQTLASFTPTSVSLGFSKVIQSRDALIHRLKYLLAFECVRRYFPIRLIKTVDLQPDRNYLFACYPHGIIPHGIMGNFFTNFTKVTELFPGIEVHVATLEIVFRLPFVREYIMALVGKPMQMPKVENPSATLIDEYQEKYFKALYDLFESNKHIHDEAGSSAKLITRPSSLLCRITDTGKFSELFPDIDVRPVTLEPIFWIPIFREYFMAAVGKPIQTPKVENPSDELIDKYHKEFFEALKDLAPLVPIFSFGENNTYDAQPVESRTMNYMNRLVYSKLKTRLPTVLRGRGILCSKGVFPYRRPINTIVGKPIEVPKVDIPSDELVDEYHEKFYKALHNLFEEYKREYDEAGDAAQLVVI